MSFEFKCDICGDHFYTSSGFVIMTPENWMKHDELFRGSKMLCYHHSQQLLAWIKNKEEVNEKAKDS